MGLDWGLYVQQLAMGSEIMREQETVMGSGTLWVQVWEQELVKGPGMLWI